MKILTADIGGTSSRFGLFASENSELTLVSTCWLNTADFGSFEAELEELVRRDFLEDSDIFVVAAAGPVENGVRVQLTQVPWAIDLGQLQGQFNLRKGVIINDFVAQAYSCVSPAAKDAEVILEGNRLENGPLVCVGAGTGLGIGAVMWLDSTRAVAIPSEGGHANYAGESDLEWQFSKFAAERFSVKYASWEDVLSGRGLEASFQFLTGEKLPAHEVGEKIISDAIITEFLAKNLGRLCRNLALTYLSSGGVYIAGGIVAKNPLIVKHPAFRETFLASRQHQTLIRDIPIYLHDNQESGLWGAAFLGAQLARS